MKHPHLLFARVFTIALLTSSHPLFGADSWSTLTEGSHNGLNWNVRGLVMLGGDLYAGGDFNYSGIGIGSEAMTRVAKWDGTGWSALAEGASEGITSSGAVYTVATGNGYLYVGGTFAAAGGAAANKIARWDPVNNDWSSLGTSGNEGVNSTVHAIAVRGDRVYAGGEFTTAAGGTVNLVPDYVGYFDTTWHSLSANSGSGPSAQINALAVADNGDVYVGGNGGFIKKWTGSEGSGTWTALGSGVSGGDVFALAIRGNKLWVGGTFTSAGGTGVNRIAVWNITSAPWEYLASPNWTSGTVNDIAFNGTGQAYVVGNLPGSSASHVHVYGTSGWLSGVPNASPGALCHAVASDRYSGKVYVGGEFTTIGGSTFNYVARWNDFEPINIADLGALATGHYSSAYGINQNGEVTGNSVNSSYVNHAFRWVNGTMNDLGSLYTGRESFGYDINDNSEVVGYGVDAYYYGRAIRWTAASGMTVLPTIFGWTFPQFARSINNSGTIVGYAPNSGSVIRAVRWDDPSVAFIDLGSLGSGTASSALGINNAGHTVGSAVTSGGQTHAFRTVANQDIDPSSDDLGTFTSGTYSTAYAINDFGEVAGVARKSDSSYRAFVTAAFGSITDSGDLGSLAGNYSVAYAINNAAQVVGTSKINSSAYRAFLFQPGWSAMANLEDLITSGTGWELNSAEAINDKGQIAGWGRLNGLPRAFLLDPTK